MIRINEPIAGRREITAVNKVLESGLLNVSAYSQDGGPYVQEFEKKLANKVGVKHAIATNSGTTALETALKALGVGRNDMVILPSFTFVADANAITSVGAIPIFCDVGEDGILDISKCEEIAKKYKIKAIILVDLYGRLSKDIEKFKTFDVLLIEDACQALGTNGAGTHGDVACFSFYSSKVINTAGSGGACVTGIDEIKERCQLVRNQGMKNGVCVMGGTNVLMPEVNAAYGCVQLGRLDGFIEQRRKNMARLGLFEDTNGYMATINTNKRNAIKAFLEENGIQCGTYYDRPIHHHPNYAITSKLDMTDNLAKTVLNLPVHPNVPIEAIDTMREAIK